MTVSFEGYTPLSTSCFSSGRSASIPPRTVLAGKLQMLWPVGNPPRLSLALLSPIDSSPSAYHPLSSSPTKHVSSKPPRQMIHLSLSPSCPAPKGSELDHVELLKKEYIRLNGIIGSMVQVDVSGMIFEGFEIVEESRKAVLQGNGSRMMGVIGGQATMLELDLPPPSKTPSWLSPTSPVSAPSPSKIPTPHPHPNISATDITSTRYRPLSALEPLFTLPLPDTKGKARPIDSKATDLDNLPSERRKISYPTHVPSEPIAKVVPLGPPSDARLGQGANPNVPPPRESFLPESGSTIETQHSTHPSSAHRVTEDTEAGVAMSDVGEEGQTGADEPEAMPSRHVETEYEQDLDMEAAIREAEEYVESQLEPGLEEMEMEDDQTDQAAGPTTPPARPSKTVHQAIPTPTRPPIIQTPVTPINPTDPGPGPTTSRLSLRRQAEAAAIAKAQLLQSEAEKTALADKISFQALGRDLILRPSHPAVGSGDGRRVSGGRTYLDPVALGGIGYTTIGNMRSKIQGSTGIIGVVLDVQGYKQTAKGDWICTLIVTDPSVHADNANSNEDFLITVFRKTQEELPVISPGTPILFRGIRVSEFNSKPKGQAYSNDLNTYATLKDAKMVYESQDKMRPPLGREEVERLAGMGRWWREKMGGGEGQDTGGGGNRVSLGAAGKGKRPLLTLGEVRDGVFCDVVYKILHVAPNPRGTPALELYITDGTPSLYPLRNFHQISHPQIPLSCIYQMAIHSQPSADEMTTYESGNVVMMRNIRPKVYKGELELSWSELVTDFQAKEGWNRRRVGKVGKEEERAKEIEKRLAALRRGEEPVSHKANDQSPVKPSEANTRCPGKSSAAVNTNSAGPSNPIPRPSSPAPIPANTAAPPPVTDIPESKDLRPVYTDPVRHPLTPLTEIDQNQTVPNRFKVRARVEKICSVGKQGGAWVLKWCNHCKRSFDTAFCQSCNDATLIDAEFQYRFLLVLSPYPSSTIPITLPVLVGDTEASSFLPPLPPLKATANPNDQRALQTRLNGIYRRVEEIIMGPKMDGERERPIAEFCLESYMARPRKGKGKEQGEGVKVFRLFGMKGME